MSVVVRMWLMFLCRGFLLDIVVGFLFLVTLGLGSEIC